MGSYVGVGGDFDGVVFLLGVGGVDVMEVVDVGGYDFEIDGVGVCGVVDNWGGVVVVGV